MKIISALRAPISAFVSAFNRRCLWHTQNCDCSVCLRPAGFASRGRQTEQSPLCFAKAIFAVPRSGGEGKVGFASAYAKHPRFKSSLTPLSALALSALFLAPLAADASVLYRGRLTHDVNGVTTFAEGDSFKMTFRVYTQPQGGAALWEFVTNAVPVQVDGGFEVLLDAPALDTALDNDEHTAYVGLALDDERELMPRRQLLSLPRVAIADVATAPAANPHFTSLAGKSLSAQKLTASSLVVDGTLTTQNANGSLSIRGVSLAANESLDVRSRKISMLGDMTTLVASSGNVACGATLATAPSDGIAFIYTDVATSAEKSLGTVRFCRRGDAIEAPIAVTGSNRISVRFYAYLTK